MQVKIKQTAIIRSIKPPFNHDHILPLSHIDTDQNLHTIIRYIRVYAANLNQQIEPFHVITTALSKTLFHYYPLAGTLHRRKSDNRLELHCELVHDGVPVVNADVGCDLTYLDSELDGNFAEQLVPDPNPGIARPMMLQVTRFECGGFVLGAAVHHAVCDGIGATLFFNAMAELARGAGGASIDPVWDRDVLLGPRNPPRVDFPIQEFLVLDKDFVPYSGNRVVRDSFSVKDGCLDQLKGVLFEKCGSKFTTFEMLSAYIWRARTKAYNVPGDEKVTFAYSMNIRKVIYPPLPVGYWGNSCVPFYVHLTSQELIEQPLWTTIDLIRKSKFNATNEYVRSFIDFQELYYVQGITAGKCVSGFTDWRHLGHSTIDFGWGGPVEVIPLSRHLLGSVEPCFFLPDNEGIKVLVHLEGDAILNFRHEMDKLSDGLQSAL